MLYDEDEVYRLERTWAKPLNGRYTPSVQERLANSQTRRDVALCIERGYSMNATIAALHTRDAEEIERLYDEMTATTEERHQRELDRIREDGRAKELLLEKRETLKREYERIFNRAR